MLMMMMMESDDDKEAAADAEDEEGAQDEVYAEAGEDDARRLEYLFEDMFDIFEGADADSAAALQGGTRARHTVCRDMVYA